MIILGIESSCDDTSVALVEASDGQFIVLAEKTASQIDAHKTYGGVVPEIAGRLHAENIMPLIEEVMPELRMKNLEFRIPDAIAVTAGPGLITGLLVGVEAAKALSYLWHVPLIPVNHIEGHIYSTLLPSLRSPANLPLQGGGNENKEKNKKNIPSPYRGGWGRGLQGIASIRFPALGLVVSGGHTELILMKDHGDYEIIGKTRDDAAGECFDKVANLIGLHYPGGPKISKLAEKGDASAIPFPRPMMDSKNYDFSFAGLKTAALYWLRDNATNIENWKLKIENLNDFCASFEQAIVDVLVAKTLRAVKEYQPKTVIIGGGVSANKKLCNTMREAFQLSTLNCELRTPSSGYSMDNGAMIAVAGYFHAIKKEFAQWRELTADPNWKIDDL